MDKTVEHESRISKLEACIEILLENHLPHLHEEIKEVKAWVKAIALAILTAMLGILARLIVG